MPDQEPSLVISEIFHSLQGESSLAGLRFAFIRLTGCDLRCSYCDSEYAFSGGTRRTITDLMKAIEPYDVQHVLVTGGEPLLQKNTPVLVNELLIENYQVSIETHGEISVAPVLDFVEGSRSSDRTGALKLIMDIKTPSSGMCRGRFRENLKLLREWDEVKFVLASREDYEWARSVIQEGKIPAREILFSPVFPAGNSGAQKPGEVLNSQADLQWLSERILADQLPVRLQLQLHKLIWGAEKKGV